MHSTAIHIVASSIVSGGALKATAALAGMCFAMWFLARIAKRRLGVGAGTIAPGALKVVGKRPLDQRSALWIVEVGGRHILLGTSMDGGVSKLDDISEAEWATMAAPESEGPAPLQAVRRLASAATNPAAARAAKTVVSADEADAHDEPDAAGEQRFATVGESFNLLLKKARDARANRTASGDDS